MVGVSEERRDPPRRYAETRECWATIRRLKTFRLRDLVGPSVSRSLASNFVRKALAAGILKVQDGHTASTHRVYELVRDVGRRFPRFDASGRLTTRPEASERMWAAIKPLRGGFQIDELSHLARASLANTRQYVSLLHTHGYLDVMVPHATGASGHRARYRLKSSMNTGPDAPMRLRDGSLWDPNREAMAEEVPA
ncbi:hypothetical protein [Azospirillum agricola]|uniref:hypothetical protein n=1 Tax=Azospirillum agricola TaxID=1720247 RepID=UPI000A0F081A|nr:hypothetical protein [Azospirillum agricola]SMH62566.1 hypothetical protein SAMN02982994_6369 [Azospirillum lipoferum]